MKKIIKKAITTLYKLIHKNEVSLALHSINHNGNNKDIFFAVVDTFYADHNSFVKDGYRSYLKFNNSYSLSDMFVSDLLVKMNDPECESDAKKFLDTHQKNKLVLNMINKSFNSWYGNVAIFEFKDGSWCLVN